MPKDNVRKIDRSVFHLPPLYKKVGIYCRVSTSRSAQLKSLTAQISGLVQKVYSMSGWKLADIYIDVCSGEKADAREEYLRMLNDCKEHKVDVILTKSVSRFGRNTEEAIKALRMLKSYGTQIIFELENVECSGSEAELIISILLAYAEADNDSRRRNQNWAIKKHLQDGTSEIYSRKCYGYQKDAKGDLIIESDEARVVQMIFSSYLEGYSILGIQKLLKDKGIPTSRGKEVWSKMAIEHILTNEKYMGNVIAMKTKTSDSPERKRIINLDEDRYMISDFVPAIISAEMFEAVQEERQRRSNIVTDETGTHRKNVRYSSVKHM